MQEHYLNVVESLDELERTIQKSSLNRTEFNIVRSKLMKIGDATLPCTLTWVPKEEPEEVKERSWLDRLRLR